MNTLQNHYGMAIRQNTHGLYAMKKAVAAVVHQSTSHSNQETCHRFCPRTEDSWCKFQRDKFTGESSYKEQVNIDPAVAKVIEPVFSSADLGADDLLKKCLHGETQNVSEALNNIIWSRCPKRVYVGHTTFKTAVASAVISYNGGAMGLVPVYRKLGIEPGQFTLSGFPEADIVRMKEANRKATDKSKSCRKHLCGNRKGFDDKNAMKEGETYE